MADPAAPTETGLSTGAKILLGCLGCLGLGVVAVAAVVAIGGVAMRDQIRDFASRVSEQRDASLVLERLRRDHPFQPPPDGVVREEQVERFLVATDLAWETMEPWAEDLKSLRELADRPADQQPSAAEVREVLGGVGSLVGFARARVQLADALDEAGMSLGEYVWTGLRMASAAEAGDATSDVPGANRELARRYGDELPSLTDDETMGPGLVLIVATAWGMTEEGTWGALGLDTLDAR